MTKLTVVGTGDDGNKGGKPSGQFDPWDTDKGFEYSEDHFYTRSTNKSDHSSDVRFRFPPHLAAMVSQIIDSKQFPQLRSVADFYRDAAVHRLHHLNEMIGDGKIESGLNIEMRIARIEARQKEVTSLKEAVEKHTGLLEDAWQSNDFEAMSDMLALLEEDIPSFRQPYRRQLKELSTRFRPRLKAWEDTPEDHNES